jgi:hypothetical protein
MALTQDSAVRINSSTTTTIFPNQGYLRKMIVADVGTTWRITIHADSASGTIIADFNPIAAASQPYIEFDVFFPSGCVVVTSGTAGDVTFTFS